MPVRYLGVNASEASCPTCSHENGGDVVFCGACGTYIGDAAALPARVRAEAEAEEARRRADASAAAAKAEAEARAARLVAEAQMTRQDAESAALRSAAALTRAESQAQEARNARESLGPLNMRTAGVIAVPTPPTRLRGSHQADDLLCSSCTTTNPADAKFCRTCGADLLCGGPKRPWWKRVLRVGVH